VILLALAAGWMPLDCGGQTLKPGTEVFAVEPSRVMELTYRSSTLQLIAHRWEAGGRFTLICLKKGQARPLICPAGANFDQVLRQLTSLRLRRTLPAKEAEDYWRKNPRPDWAEMGIRDNSQLEPFTALIKPVEGSPQEAVVRFGGATYIVELDAKVFQLLAGGCKTLGAGEK